LEVPHRGEFSTHDPDIVSFRAVRGRHMRCARPKCKDNQHFYSRQYVIVAALHQTIVCVRPCRAGQGDADQGILGVVDVVGQRQRHPVDPGQASRKKTA
jgi:hypothetical protein